MTDLLVRPHTAQRAEPSRPLVVPGALAAAWTVIVGLTGVLVVVLIVWAADPR